MTIAIDVGRASASVNRGLGIYRYASAVAIPAAQRYYWTPRWQQGESETAEDLQLGEFEEFADIGSALAWLDAP